MKSKKTKARNFVAKHAKACNRHVVHENKKRKAEEQYWNGLKKGSLWDLI